MKKLAGLFAMLAALIGGGAYADEVADFYKGRQIQLVIGYGPGGGYDLNARLLARHIGQHIPGHPTIVAQNMPGAGSLRAANFVAAAAPRDGTVIAAVDRQTPLTAVLGGNPAVKFKLSDINWLGTISSYANDAFVLFLRKDAQVKSADDLLRPGGPFATVGGSAIGSTDDTTVIILRDALHLNLKLVTGYPDGNAISLALERGEVQGRTAGLSAIASTRPQWLAKDSLVRPILQIGRLTRHPDYKDVPTARELAKDAKARSIIAAMEMTYQLARPYIMPPNLPPQRLAALRKAFMDATTSPAMKAEAEKMRIELSPVDGVEAARRVAEMAKAPPEALDYLRNLLVKPAVK